MTQVWMLFDMFACALQNVDFICDGPFLHKRHLHLFCATVAMLLHGAMLSFWACCCMEL
jgi:hypothetical protein